MKFFRRLAEQGEMAGLKRAWGEGLLRCPKCGEHPRQKPADVNTLTCCDSCGYESLPGEWVPDPSERRVGRPERIPSGTKILRETSGGGEAIWQIPASGKFGFFGFFGTFWTAITAVVSGVFLFGGSSSEGGEKPWFIYPFFAVFWAVGLGCLYAALRSKFACHRVTVGADQVTLRREMFGRVKERSLPVGDVSAVEQAVFYQQNYQPVYGIEIRARGGKLRFGTTLSDEEKAWLVADIRRAVMGDVNEDPAGVPGISPAVAARQSSFSFALPPLGNIWVLGVVMMVISLGVLGFFGFQHFAGNSDAPLGRVLSGVFYAVPLVMGTILFGVGATILHRCRPRRGFETRLEGDDSQISIRDYQYGRLIREQAFPRGAVKGARASHTGDANGKPMKRIDLIAHGRAIRLRSWTDGGLADAWVAEVNGAIGENASF